MSNKRLYLMLAPVFLTNLTGLPFSGNTAVAPSDAQLARSDQGAEVSPSNVYTGPRDRAVTLSLAYMLGFSLGSATMENLNPNPEIRARAPKSYSEAQEIGRSFGVELPSLPKYSGNRVSDTAAAVNYVFNQASPSIKRAMDQNDESEVNSAHFSFAVMTALAATFYDPRDSEEELAGTLVSALKQAGKKTGLPSNIWREPVDLLERRASVDKVTRSLQAIAAKVLKYYGVS